MSTKILKDSFHFHDEVNRSTHPRTLWARTQVIGGYGLRKNSLGISSLDEVIFETENMVPLIGVQYAMETIFGVKCSQIQIPTLNTTMGIGVQDPTITIVNEDDGDDPDDSPTSTDEMPYKYGQKVCLFGVGTGGAADNNLTALDVKYNETSIKDMVPFRYTMDEITGTDANKYFGKRLEENGYTAYFLKEFDSPPTIKHLYKSAEEGEDGALVNNTDFFKVEHTQKVQSFTECLLSINRKDVREYFAVNGHIEDPPRVNSIALFTAVKAGEDYAQIQLFSKLNIPTETLSLSKDMNIIYRVYGA